MSPALQACVVVLLILAGVVAVPAFVLLIQVAVAAFTRPAPPHVPSAAARPSVAILMPAHNEAAGITTAVASVLLQLRPGDRLLVVADNCSDDTAGVARAAGAEVTERHDPLRRGKGYALDFGVRALESRPPAIVVVMDADCTIEEGSLERLVRRCESSGRPVQALYLMRSPAEAGLKTRISEFAWVVKNQVRPTGFLCLGLPCQLMGTGMAFPWAIIGKAPLASGHLVEDMQLGIDLAMAGVPPLFCVDACVTSVFPSSDVGAVAQHTRWEHGHLSMIASGAPRLLAGAVTRLRLDLAAMALDLCVPPLASLALSTTVIGALSALLYLLTGSIAPLLVATGAAGAIGLAIGLAWRSFGRGILSLADLLSAPGYALAKLPIYVKALTRRQQEWIRARRDGE
jgi:cellulose synthase/poly-beta-1,6-N-acetylglucosamine synthase-like glycosyltransferase